MGHVNFGGLKTHCPSYHVCADSSLVIAQVLTVLQSEYRGPSGLWAAVLIILTFDFMSEIIWTVKRPY